MPPLYGEPDEMEDMPEDDGDAEVAKLASEAFPGVQVNTRALRELIDHCMGGYGGADEDEGDPKEKAALMIAFGPKKKG